MVYDPIYDLTSVNLLPQFLHFHKVPDLFKLSLYVFVPKHLWHLIDNSLIRSHSPKVILIPL
jgi:hypothetical protein